MTTPQTVKQYGELAVAQGRSLAEQARTPLLAVVGAGDLAVERARTVLDQFRSRAEALPAWPGRFMIMRSGMLICSSPRSRATSTLRSGLRPSTSFAVRSNAPASGAGQSCRSERTFTALSLVLRSTVRCTPRTGWKFSRTVTVIGTPLTSISPLVARPAWSVVRRSARAARS